MTIPNTFTAGTKAKASEVNENFQQVYNPLNEVFKVQYGDSVISGCAITEQSSPDQTAAMASGKVLISGEYYAISADASFSFTNADGSNPRWDIVSIDSAGTVTVTAGTAAATPVVPTLPTDEVPLAVVYRAASDNTIETADIKDCRRLVAEEYYYNDSTRDTDTTSTYTTIKTVTIPAFRIQKYIDVTFDLSGFIPETTTVASSDNTFTDSCNIQILVTGASTVTKINTFSVDANTLTSVTSESQSATLRYTVDDSVDWTQPVTVEFKMHGGLNAETTGTEITAVNNFMTVIGK